MIIIKQNESGNIVIDRKVLEHIVIEETVSMGDSFVMCNKKGKTLKHGILKSGDKLYESAIQLTAAKGIEIAIFCLARKETDISLRTEELFDNIEKRFERISLPLPERMTVDIKGILGQPLYETSHKVVREHA